MVHVVVELGLREGGRPGIRSTVWGRPVSITEERGPGDGLHPVLEAAPASLLCGGYMWEAEGDTMKIRYYSLDLN
jgi:hypothetical protein